MPVFRRLFFRCTNFVGSNLSIDVLMDEKRHWIERVPACGWWGRIDSDNFLPFVAKAGGTLDFGSYIDEETGEPTPGAERYAEIDITNRILAIGEQFTIIYNGDSYLLLLERLVDVSSL